jgi:AcrR family transcriptional regulator
MNQADPRVKRTRKLLQNAFMELLAEKGFHTVSVQDVAERATVNRATFYAHFPDKYALLDEVVGDAFREALLRRVPPGAPFTLDNLELLTAAVLGYLADFYSHCRPSDRELAPLVETRMQRELSELLVRWLQELQSSDSAPPVTPETTASVMSWAIFGAGMDWSRGPRTDALEQRAHQIVVLLTGGLSHLGNLPSEARTRELAMQR